MKLYNQITQLHKRHGRFIFLFFFFLFSFWELCCRFCDSSASLMETVVLGWLTNAHW